MKVLEWVYLPLLFVNAFLSIRQWRLLSKADRYIAILLSLTAATELIGQQMAHRYMNNLLVYRIYNIIALLLVAKYFDRCVFARTKTMRWIASGIVLLFSMAAIVVLPITSEGHATILLIQATMTIAFCLFSIRQILLQMENLPYRFVQFWLTCAFLLYWSLTFTGWGVSYFATSKNDPLAVLFFPMLILANLALYTATALILFFYKKLIPSGE